MMQKAVFTVLAAALALGSLVATSVRAHADEVAVVLDYGAGERDAREARFRTALEVVRAFETRGDTVTLLGLGARDDGRTRSADLYQALRENDAEASLGRVMAQAEESGYGLEYRTHVDAALAAALGRHGANGPLTVVLVGPFSGTADRGKSDDDPNEDASDEGNEAQAGEDTRNGAKHDPSAWAEAPAESRIFVLGSVSDAALEVLANRAGHVGRGWLVLAYGNATAAPTPWSPLGVREGAPADHPLEATVGWSVHAVPLAQDDTTAPRTLDVVIDGTNEGVTHTARGATIERPLTRGREARVSFRPRTDADEALVVLTSVPDPVAMSWTTLRPDARLWDGTGGPATAFDGKDTEARAPKKALLRIVRTRVGAAPRWAIRVETEDGRPVPGLSVRVDAEIPAGEHIAVSNVHVELAPPPAHPFEAKGRIRLAADGTDPLVLPFHVSAPAGKVRLAPTTEAATLVLPAAADDAVAHLRVSAENGSAPSQVTVIAQSPSAALRGRLRLPDGNERVVALDAPFRIPLDEDLTLVLELTDRESWRTLAPGVVTLRLAEMVGVETRGEVAVSFRARRPHLQASEAEPRYDVERDGVVAIRPVDLLLDSDGGDGEWLLDRMAVAPEIDGDGAWRVEALRPGAWRVVHEGQFDGPRADPFEDTTVPSKMTVRWAEGEAPGEITVEVVVPARWGARGWWFVALATAALGLATFTFVKMRAPKITGTLLYTVDGMARTVGRLDLAPVGRRTTVLRADDKGRLTLGKEGSPLGIIRPTRVGGMLEIPGEDGAPERRLLVDGLSVRVDKHAMRYVSGVPDESKGDLAPIDVPDLLGPEFDLETSLSEPALPAGGSPANGSAANGSAANRSPEPSERPES